MKRRILVAAAAMVGVPLLAVALGLFGGRDLSGTLADGTHPGLTPELVEEIILPGGSVDIEKTVHTPEIPPRPDICFLADTTGSMFPVIANVQTNAANVLNAVSAVQPDAQFCVAHYTDFNCSDPDPYNLDQPVTADTTNVENAINGWATGDGCDTPEAQLNALFQLATDPGVGFRLDSTRIIVWFGDASGHDPSNGHSLADAIDALNVAGIRVVAVDVDITGPFSDGLDNTGQATAITAATGGVLLTGVDPDDITDAILTGLSNLPVDVAMDTDCADPISVSFAPAVETVVSGEHAVFTETITVADDAGQDVTYECDDWATIDGVPMADAAGNIIKEHKVIYVPDVVPPEASCIETTNPAGKKVPPAGSTTLPGPKGGQNEDGFYELLAEDIVDPNPGVFVYDMGSSAVFGPFASGDKIKYTEAKGATPSMKPMGSGNGQAGAITAHIIGNGDAAVFAVDASGNVSDRALCLVPPPPK